MINKNLSQQFGDRHSRSRFVSHLSRSAFGIKYCSHLDKAKDNVLKRVINVHVTHPKPRTEPGLYTDITTTNDLRLAPYYFIVVQMVRVSFCHGLDEALAPFLWISRVDFGWMQPDRYGCGFFRVFSADEHFLQASDLAASYAALILADEGIEITVRTQDSPPAGA